MRIKTTQVQKLDSNKGSFKNSDPKKDRTEKPSDKMLSGTPIKKESKQVERLSDPVKEQPSKPSDKKAK